MRTRWFTLTAVLVVTASAARAAEVLKQIPLGGETHWEALALDSVARRLYVTRDSHITILDVDTEKVVGEVPNLAGARDVAIAPEIDRGYVTCSRANLVSIFSLKKLTYLGTIEVGKSPGSIVWDFGTRRFFVMNPGSSDVSVIDANDGELEGTVALGGRPRGAVVDGKGAVFINLEDTGELIELDAKKMSITRRTSLAPCQSPSAIAIDREAHRIFSGCSNRLVAIVHPDAGAVASTISAGLNIGTLAFDPDLHLLAASAADGTVALIFENAGEHFISNKSVMTSAGSATMALDPVNHKLFVPVSNLGTAPGIHKEGVSPESFGLLVLGIR